jgi:hypothetical protein
MDNSDFILATKLVLIFVPWGTAAYIYIHYELRDWKTTFGWRKATEPRVAYAFLAYFSCIILAGVALVFLPWQ